MERYASEPVAYRRGTAAIEIMATRASKAADEQQTGSESTVQGIRVDWLVRANQIKRTEGDIVPIDGDTLTDLAGVEYRVTKNPVDGKLARWMPQRVALRIHTIIVKGE
ncbi:hypothetical protein [Aureliella helgolandensis]|uniref:Phage head-tail joining protein domain-containing protein n=1 Tax=Aureliella helgolandensis TaxID=2527968 RepID=A0A518G4A8_9BACT|nr:hypothetical protein [Aureliella helgolandensis]QDV23433.1 hypothetical protein Q31a_17310 [Aureliella helgolandensis]